MKQLSSITTGLACSGSSTPPMPAPPEMMDVLADLRAGADGRPGVDHRALADVGADVDEARHQHRALADERAAADDRAGDDAEARGVERLGGPIIEFGLDLVERRRAARTIGDELVVAQPEGQQHRLLEPLVDLPVAVLAFLGDAQRAFVEMTDRDLDRLACRPGAVVAELVAIVPGSVDGGGEVGGHAASPKSEWSQSARSVMV